MNFSTVQKTLIDTHKHNPIEVDIYTKYLNKLKIETNKQGQLKNAWFKYFTEDQAIGLFNKVSLDNLFIDGETITLTFKGSVIVTYDYQAYKNRMLNAYPESMIDVQNVYEGDTFSFKKNSGKVIYTHDLNDPFSTTEKKIIGSYCIIKNSRGEFIETLNLTEINKMRNVATTKNIWDLWFGEMCLKSVIKRACKRHFKDKFENIEKLDNENYNLDNVETPFDIQKEIDNCKTNEELNQLYRDNLNNVTDMNNFIILLQEKREELNSNLNTSGDDNS